MRYSIIRRMGLCTGPWGLFIRLIEEKDLLTVWHHFLDWDPGWLQQKGSLEKASIRHSVLPDIGL